METKKKYVVEYQINVDGETSINSEIVIAYNKKEAFVKAVNQGEQRFLSKGYKCIISQNIEHYKTVITDITDLNVEKEIDDILNDILFK